MKNVELQPIGKTVEVKTESSVLDAMLAEELKVLMACGGKGMCATCHVWVDKGMEQLTPMSAREKRTLSRVSGCDERSRLSCQAKILGEGVTVKLPDGMFIESTKDLESLIGSRSKTNMLHPIDGRILVAKGKIITRSRIMELAEVDVDMDRLKKEAEEI